MDERLVTRVSGSIYLCFSVEIGHHDSNSWRTSECGAQVMESGGTSTKITKLGEK